MSATISFLAAAAIASAFGLPYQTVTSISSIAFAVSFLTYLVTTTLMV